MHIFLLGATGPSGLAFLDEALKSGHEVTIFARNPSKLPPATSSNPKIHIVQGEFSDLDKAKEALAYGVEVLVSFVGPTLPSAKGTPVADFYRAFFPLVVSHSNIKRAMITSTASYKAPEDRFALKWWFGITMIRLFGGSAYAEINGLSRATIECLPLEDGGVEWTLMRVPVLTNQEVKPVQAGFIGSGQDAMFLGRRSLCIWVLNEIEERKWVGKAPNISNVGWL